MGIFTPILVDLFLRLFVLELQEANAGEVDEQTEGRACDHKTSTAASNRTTAHNRLNKTEIGERYKKDLMTSQKDSE